MSWTVLSYETLDHRFPVEEFIQQLPKKDQAKVIYVIDLLSQFGITLRHPHSKALQGYPNLYELRVQLASNIQRIFYCHFDEKTFVMLHGFTKKTQKTPSREIHIAINRQKDLLNRKGKAK